MEVAIKKLKKQAKVPEYKSIGAAGFDFAALEDVTIMPSETLIIGSGLSFEIPQGYELRVQPRSGLSAKTKLRISNSPGAIDSDYRGEVGIIMDNIGDTPYHIKAGDRIAQGIISPVIRASFIEKDELSETQRGSLGFGSSGV